MASGDTLVALTPKDFQGTATTGARPGRTNEHPVYLFAGATANESAVAGNQIMPSNYGGGGVTVYIQFAMSSATTGDVDWDVQFERVDDAGQNITSDGFAAVQSVDNTTVPGTAGITDVVSVAFTSGTQMDSIVADDGFRVKITRDQASDTAAGDAELWAVRIEET